MSRTILIAIVAAIGAAIVAGVDLLASASADASLLLALLFWTGLLQGTVALVAAVELAEGEWLEANVRQTLAGLAPLQLLLPVAFLLVARHLEIYPWLHHSTGWLAPGFFVARNLAMLTVTALLGIALFFAVRSGGRHKGTLAVLYLFAFVATQSLAAFDWVMPLDMPWISTMFAPLFFVEALLVSMALAVVVSATLFRRARAPFRASLKDSATLMFGLGLLWAGLFFAQYLTIWYGNIPEEVSFFHTRFHHPSGVLFYFILFGYFFIPFPTLIIRPLRTVPAVVVPLAALIGGTFLLERIFYLAPHCEISPALTVVYLLALGAPVAALVISRVRSVDVSTLRAPARH